MKYYNDIEEEVDAIRDKIYLIIKDMTSQECVEYINSSAREIMKKYGIGTANNSPAASSAEEEPLP